MRRFHDYVAAPVIAPGVIAPVERKRVGGEHPGSLRDSG